MTTGPDAETSALVLARAGFRCENCGLGITGPLGYSKQHRVPRGMGGTRREWINWASNLAVLCGSATTGCHGRCEKRDTEMYVRGYWLATGDDLDKPIRLFDGRWVELTDSGLYLPCPTPIAA